MARPRTRRREAATDRKPKKRVSILDTEQVVWIDYKDVNLLRRFMSERAKIRARRVTGNSAQQQRAVARAIRVAREMGLLPYNVRQVTHRSKRSRDRGDDRGILESAVPLERGAPPVERGAPPVEREPAPSEEPQDASPEVPDDTAPVETSAAEEGVEELADAGAHEDVPS